MHGLMIATYVLKAQHQNESDDKEFLAAQAQSDAWARRVLVSLAAGFAGVTACLVAVGVFG